MPIKLDVWIQDAVYRLRKRYQRERPRELMVHRNQEVVRGMSQQARKAPTRQQVAARREPLRQRIRVNLSRCGPALADGLPQRIQAMPLTWNVKHTDQCRLSCRPVEQDLPFQYRLRLRHPAPIR